MGLADGDAEGWRRVKSVKLIDLPTCQQLVTQHEMLQLRLQDVVEAPTHTARRWIKKLRNKKFSP